MLKLPFRFRARRAKLAPLAAVSEPCSILLPIHLLSLTFLCLKSFTKSAYGFIFWLWVSLLPTCSGLLLRVCFRTSGDIRLDYLWYTLVLAIGFGGQVVCVFIRVFVTSSRSCELVAAERNFTAGHVSSLHSQIGSSTWSNRTDTWIQLLCLDFNT